MYLARADRLARLLTLALLLPLPAMAQDSDLSVPAFSGEPEAWLVSYAPGNAYWQRFGHNAIWIREPGMGIDHVFNFGFFDFKQERFLARFIQGNMLYFSMARSAVREFRQYQFEQRSISAQKLDLAPEAFVRLRDYLLEQVQPENRNYRYDYYLDNCSTRVRDALDFALDGALLRQFGNQPARQNFRAHTRRLVSMDFWYYLGLESALGLPVDRDITRWDEMFLPSVVADVLSEATLDTRALVTGKTVIFQAGLAPPPSTPPPVWRRYLLLALLLTAALSGIGKLAGPVMSAGLVLTWLMIAASGGLILSGLWLFTDHQVAGPNSNLLLLNPLFLAGLWPGLRRFAAFALAGGLALAAVLLVLPSAQFNVDVFSFAVPLNGACAWWLWRKR